MKCEAAAVPFQIGASFPTPQLALERARRAAQLCPGAIQVILPDWYPLSLHEAAAFLERIAEATAPVPLILYNPPHAKRVLSPRTMLCCLSQFRLLLESRQPQRDDDWYERMRPLSSRLSVFVPGDVLATGIARGASGSYSNVACLHPTGAKRWNELMRRDWGEAKRIEEQIQRFLTTYVVPFRERRGFSNMALDKLLAFIGNWCPIGTRLRWPYVGIDESEAKPLRVRARGESPISLSRRVCASDTSRSK